MKLYVVCAFGLGLAIVLFVYGITLRPYENKLNEEKIKIDYIKRDDSVPELLQHFQKLVLLDEYDFNKGKGSCAYFGPVPYGKGEPKFLITLCYDKPKRLVN